MAALSDTLGLEQLQLERTEFPVGPYYADILAKSISGEYVVIENQFNKTNHDHLGKLVTYGATLGASIVIWIAEKFSEEHKKAIEWLNEHTTSELSFFAVQLEAFQIDESSPAIQFKIISSPNELIRAATLAKTSGNLSENQKLQLEFWTEFQKRLLEKKVVTSTQTPRPQYWFDVPLGRSGIYLSNTLNTSDQKIGVRVYISNRVGDAALNQLMSQRDAIEMEIGLPLQWNPNPEKRDKIIATYRDVDLSIRSEWPEYVDWFVDLTQNFRKAFMPRVKRLELTQPIAGYTEVPNA